MLCNKKEHCEHQGNDGWSDKPTCELDYYKFDCEYQDRTQEQEQWNCEHADMIDIMCRENT